MQVTLRAQFCKIDGRVVWRAVWGADAGAVLGFCLGLFEVLVTVQAHFMRLVAVLFGAMARAFCEIDSRVLGSMQFGVLLQVPFWGAIWGLCWCNVGTAMRQNSEYFKAISMNL